MKRLLVLSVLLVACAGRAVGGDLEADATSGKASMELLDSMRFSPNILRAKGGGSVTLAMKNTGSTIHNFVSPALGVPRAVKVDPGKSGSVSFGVPAAAGTYEFWCDEPGHKEAGMTGRVVVP